MLTGLIYEGLAHAREAMKSARRTQEKYTAEMLSLLNMKILY